MEITPREIFEKTGPLHLPTYFDWRNKFHQKSLAASLVQGVYNLEHDRQARSSGHKHDATSSQWWERFHFQLNGVLVDDNDSSYFGAIYELKYAHPVFYQSRPYPPRYVIAFRGTIIKFATHYEDMKLNMKCVFDKLEDSPRFRTAIAAVRNMVWNVGPASVWLAGHSLGAAIAMLVGRNMATSRDHLETYLFNPPFISNPIERLIKNETLKHGVRIPKSLMTAGIATAMRLHHKDPAQDPFNMLSEWTPYLFVNQKDPICSGYIGYFEHRDTMKRNGMGKIEGIATKQSIRSLVLNRRNSEPWHLLPNADITENRSPTEGFRQPHGILQWWQEHLQLELKQYKFNSLFVEVE